MVHPGCQGGTNTTSQAYPEDQPSPAELSHACDHVDLTYGHEHRGWHDPPVHLSCHIQLLPGLQEDECKGCNEDQEVVGGHAGIPHFQHHLHAHRGLCLSLQSR
jgi:hypothetical protein